MPLVNKDILAGSVTTPAVGNTTLFTDGGKLFTKQSSGAVAGVNDPAGLNHNIQYNNSGAVAGNSGNNYYDATYGDSMITVGDDPNDPSPNGLSGTVRLGGSGNFAITNNIGVLNVNSNFINATNAGATSFSITPNTGSGYPGVISFNSTVDLTQSKTFFNLAGRSTLVGGTVNVLVPYSNSDTNSAYSMVMVTIQSLGTVTVPQAMYVSNMTASVFPSVRGSFDITSADPTDTSTVAWFIIN